MDQTARQAAVLAIVTVNEDMSQDMAGEAKEAPAPTYAGQVREDLPYYTQTEMLLRVEDKKELLDFTAR